MTKHLSLKEHHMNMIKKHEANDRLHQIDDANSFLEKHNINDFNAELEDIPQLLREAGYEWAE
tara:strand:- start:383 stop:571 length:189 start_codon:yes stop_codon:yes gene_type:complete